MIYTGPLSSWKGEKFHKDERDKMTENDRIVIAIRSHMLSYMRHNKQDCVDIAFVFKCTHLFLDNQQSDDDKTMFDLHGTKRYLKEMIRDNFGYYKMSQTEKIIWKIKMMFL